MAAVVEKDPPPPNPFTDLPLLLPELDMALGETWAYMLKTFEVEPTCELHSLNDACTKPGCVRLLAFRVYVKEYSSWKAWQRWQAREQKKEMREFLKRLEIAGAPEKWDFKGDRVMKKMSVLNEEAKKRGPQLESLFNQYWAYLRGEGPKPEV